MKIPMIYTLISTTMVSAFSINAYASDLQTPTKEEMLKRPQYTPFSPFTADVLVDDERTKIHQQNVLKKQAITHAANLKAKQDESAKLLQETKAKNEIEMKKLEDELDQLKLKRQNDKLLLERNKELKKEVEKLKSKSEELELAHSSAKKEFEEDKEKMTESRKNLVAILQKSRDDAREAYQNKVQELNQMEIQLAEVNGKVAEQEENFISLQERYSKLHQKAHGIDSPQNNNLGGDEEFKSDDEDTVLGS